MASKSVLNSRKKADCLARVKAWSQDAVGARARVASYILKRPEEAHRISIDRLARKCRTSASTVSRFCQDVGYKGFKELQVELAAAFALEPPEPLGPFDATADPVDIVRHVFEHNVQSLANTLKLIDYRVLVEISRAVEKARKTILLGVGGSGIVAAEAKMRLLTLGLTVIAAVDPFEQVYLTADVDTTDVVIGISHTGQTKSIVESVKQARKRRAYTVAMTNYPQSPLAMAAKRVLVTSTAERRINAAVSSSRIPQLCIFDALYFVLASWSTTKAGRLARQSERMARSILRG